MTEDNALVTDFFEDEVILADDFPVYYDYVYIADGKVIVSDIEGTVRDLRRDVNVKEIRSCSIFKRFGSKQ